VNGILVFYLFIYLFIVCYRYLVCLHGEYSAFAVPISVLFSHLHTSAPARLYHATFCSNITLLLCLLVLLPSELKSAELLVL